ncbi:MAG: hypothetical protein Kow0080_01620 [Candidatus Promineifilaceae bacterium]
MGLNRVSERLHRWATGWMALGATAVFVLFVAFVLPRMTGGGDTAVPIPDVMFTYSAGTLYQIADALGEAGRSEYIRARFTFDVVWPVVYTSFLVMATSWLTTFAFPATSLWQKANLLPLAAVLFDLLENLAASLVMARYPAKTAVIAELAGLFTLVKWVLVGAAFVVLVGTAVQALRRKIQSPKS